MTLTVAAVTAYLPMPAIQVDVTSSPSITDGLRLYRVHEDGTRYRVLLTANAVVVGSFAGYDYHAPFNQFVSYVAETDTVVSVASDPVIIPNPKSLWLIHPSRPELSWLADSWASTSDYEYEESSQSYQVLGRSDPVVRTDYPRSGEKGTITVKCVGMPQVIALKALLADGGPILIDTPFGDNEIGWKWVQPGRLTMKNPATFTQFKFRYGEIPYTECAQPDADSMARTYDQRQADFPGATYADMALVYDTYRDSTLDVRI